MPAVRGFVLPAVTEWLQIGYRAVLWATPSPAIELGFWGQDNRWLQGAGALRCAGAPDHRVLRAFEPRVRRARLRREVGVPRPEACRRPLPGVRVGGGGGREGWGGSDASLERVYQGLGAKAASSDSFLPCKSLLLVG